MEPWTNIKPAGPLLRPKDAAAFLGISKPSYYRLMRAGRVPPTVAIAHGPSAAVGVPVAWLNALIAAAPRYGDAHR